MISSFVLADAVGVGLGVDMLESKIAGKRPRLSQIVDQISQLPSKLRRSDIVAKNLGRTLPITRTPNAGLAGPSFGVALSPPRLNRGEGPPNQGLAAIIYSRTGVTGGGSPAARYDANTPSGLA